MIFLFITNSQRVNFKMVYYNVNYIHIRFRYFQLFRLMMKPFTNHLSTIIGCNFGSYTNIGNIISPQSKIAQIFYLVIFVGALSDFLSSQILRFGSELDDTHIPINSINICQLTLDQTLSNYINICNTLQMDYYGSLGLTKTASQQQIKQAYKKLALKHHPDKNEDKETAKIKFTQITEAYTVLNNPQKKAYYDKYGIAENEMQDFSDFQQFMGDFNFFQDFLDDLLMFDNIKQWEKMMKTMNKKGKKKGRGRGKRKRTKDLSEEDLLNVMMKGMNMDDQQLDMKLLSQMMNGEVGQQQLALFQAMMGGAQMDMQFEDMMMGMLGGGGLGMKGKKKSQKKVQVEEEQDWQLTPEELQILQFGKKNIQTVKRGSKRVKVCKFDKEKVKQEDILSHFSEKHKKEFQQSISIKKQQNK